MPNFDVTQLSLLFFPGILARIILGRLLFYKDNGTFSFTISAFVLGVMSYAILFIIFNILSALCINIDNSEIVLFDANSKNITVNYKQITFASIVAIVMSCAISYFESNKFLYKIIKNLKISNRFYEPDVWNYTLNSEITDNNPWVNVRLRKDNLVYQGRLKVFSDSYEKAELLLEEVTVFENLKPNELYSSYAVYLSLPKDNIEIEFYEGGRKNEPKQSESTSSTPPTNQ